MSPDDNGVNSFPDDNGANHFPDDLSALRSMRSDPDAPTDAARSRAEKPWKSDGSGDVVVVDMEPRRTKARRSFAVRSAIALGTAAALTGGVFVFESSRIDGVKPPNTVHLTTRPTMHRGSALMGAQTFLLIGSDSRSFVSTGEPEPFGVSGSRSDTVVLVRVDPRNKTLRVLSIPRDLWVAIPGHGEQKVNAAYTFGGAPLLVDTIVKNVRIAVDHVIEADFLSFRALVDELGGINIGFAHPTRDNKSGLFEPAGCGHLDGIEALNYSRSRHTEYLIGGRWVPDHRADLGRVLRQQVALRQLGARILANVGSDPAALLRRVLSHLVVDDRLRARDLLGLFSALHSDAKVITETFAVRPELRGQQAVLVSTPDASRQIDAFLSGRPEISAATGPATKSSQAIRRQAPEGATTASEPIQGC